MGYTALGYELSDGSVQYCLLPKAYNLDDLELCLKDQGIPPNTLLTKQVYSINEYFRNDITYNEDTRWRILYKLDGTTVCRLFSLAGNFIYDPSECFEPSSTP